MKILTIIFCLLFSINTFAQSVNALHDTILSGKVSQQAPQKDTNNFKTIIMDGEPPMANINKVFKDSIIKKGSGSNSSIAPIKASDLWSCQYQEKLSFFSKDYKNYLEANNNDEKNEIIYVVNGTPLQGKLYEIVDKLCQIPDDKIKKAIFFKRWSKELENIQPMMVIVTKR